MRDSNSSSSSSFSSGTSSRTRTPPRAPAFSIDSVAPIKAARSLIPRIPVPGWCPCGSPRPGIDDGQREHAVAVRELELGGRHAGMAGDVRQRLLRDAIHDELGLGREHRQAGSDPLGHLEARPLGEPLTEHGQRALEPEVVQRLGPQFDGDAPQILEAAAHRVLHLEQALAQLVGDAALHAREREQHGGQLLADLVVQLLRDSQTLCLLAVEHASGRLTALCLQPRQHLVERDRQLPGLGGGGGRGHPLARRGEVDAARERGQRDKRTDDAAHQVHVQRHHEHERHAQHDGFLVGVQRRDALGRQHRDRDHDGDEQQQRVDARYAIEQRHISAPFRSL